MTPPSGLYRDSLLRRITAEGLGTALLVAAVAGSGIMGERLAAGNSAVALLANSLATGAVLLALILAFGSISGAHFNPAVTLMDASLKGLSWVEAPVYIVAQMIGAIVGVLAANAMFNLPLVVVSHKSRSGASQLLGEFIATFGLLAVIHGCSRLQARLVPFAVAAYITAAYWFTSSTSFANPAVTIARTLTDTFSGIRPVDAPPFIIAQVLGAAAATFVLNWLLTNHVDGRLLHQGEEG